MNESADITAMKVDGISDQRMIGRIVINDRLKGLACA